MVGILKSMGSCPWTWLLMSAINRGPCFPRTILVVLGLHKLYAAISHQAHRVYKVKKRLQNFTPQNSTKKSLAHHLLCSRILSMTIDHAVIWIQWILYFTSDQHLPTESLNKKTLSEAGSFLEELLTRFQNRFPLGLSYWILKRSWLSWPF